MKKIVSNFRVLFFVLLSIPFALFGQDKLLLLHPEGVAFTEAIESMTRYLEGGVELEDLLVSESTSLSDVKKKISDSSPKMFVLFDNPSIRLYKKYVDDVKASGGEALGAVALMALQLPFESEGLGKIIGIKYEIPVLTSVVNLRMISSKKIENVGVIYREGWSEFIDENLEYCKSEKINLIKYELDNEPKLLYSAIKKGLKKLIKKEKVDALWIVSDEKLFIKKAIKKAWLAGLRKTDIPTIVGVETLIKSPIRMGSFAVLPDHNGLGEQVANLIFELMDQGWVVDEKKFEEPLSVLKVLNTKLALKKGFLNDKAMGFVDKEVE